MPRRSFAIPPVETVLTDAEARDIGAGPLRFDVCDELWALREAERGTEALEIAEMRISVRRAFKSSLNPFMHGWRP